jgi:hypothetical protein
LKALFVIRGALIWCLQAFSIERPPAKWYRRYFPLIVLILALIGGTAAFTVVTELLVVWVNAWTGSPAGQTIAGGVRGSMVVAWLALLGFAITSLNLAVPAFKKKPLVLVVPDALSSWLSGVAAVGLGLLIGISVFR